MKQNRPRIFIVRKVVQTLKGDSEEVPQRASSKRRPLFKAVVERLNSVQKREKYQYNLGGHIQVESFGTLLNCDFAGNQCSSPKRRTQRQEDKQIKTNKEENPQNTIKEGEQHPISPQIVISPSDQRPIDHHSRSFTTSPRARIFSSANFTLSGRLSTLTCNHTRKNIFNPHSSQPISLNASRSKQRRRIFSNDHKPFHSVIHPLFPQQPPKMPPLQMTIKEEDEISRITEIVPESVYQSRLPNMNGGHL